MATNETSKYKLSVTEGTELQLSLNGPTGSTGPSNVLTIGSVISAENGDPAAATITGTSPSQVLNLTLPKGNVGPAANISIGNTTTGTAGSDAIVTNTGTSGAAIFNFTIPRGNTGATGPANTLTVASTNTGAAGTQASVTISGTSPNQSLTFTIPKGDKGDTGATGPVGPTGQSSSYYPYLAKTTVYSGDPASTFLLWNNATQRNSTQLNVSHITADSSDVDVFLILLKTNDYLIIQSKTDSNNYQKWQISSTPTVTSNSYVQIPVTYVDAGGTGFSNFSNNEQLIFVFITLGATGPAGPANTLSIGNVTTGGIGVSGATITGTAPNQTLNLTLPTGATGASNTLAIGNVTAGDIGVANATITGASPNQTLNLTLPTGATGATGPANSLTVSSTTTGAAGSSASVSVTGTAPTQALQFTIPRGDTGATGSAATVSAGTTTTGAAGSSASVTNSGSTSAAVFNFTIPRGDTGSTGPIGPSIESLIITESTTARTLLLTDTNQYIRCTNASQITITVPPESSVSWVSGATIYFRRDTSAGAIQLSAGAGVTINNFATAATVLADNNFAIKKVGTNIWDFI
jgi:hypothetical protein